MKVNIIRFSKIEREALRQHFIKMMIDSQHYFCLEVSDQISSSTKDYFYEDEHIKENMTSIKEVGAQPMDARIHYIYNEIKIVETNLQKALEEEDYLQAEALTGLMSLLQNQLCKMNEQGNKKTP